MMDGDSGDWKSIYKVCKANRKKKKPFEIVIYDIMSRMFTRKK